MPELPPAASRLFRRTLVVALVVLAPSIVHAQRPPAADTAVSRTLIELERQSWRAWKARDTAFFRGFLSDDHVELGAGGPATANQVVATVGSPACVIASYVTDRFQVRMISATTALVVYHAAQDTKCNGVAVPSPVWVSSLYVLRNGRWLNAAYQQTAAAR